MPDHVHLLLEGMSDGSDLREAMRVWKQVSAHDWRARSGTSLWQSGFHDHVLRADDDTHGVVGYVLLNPVRADSLRVRVTTRGSDRFGTTWRVSRRTPVPGHRAGGNHRRTP